MKYSKPVLIGASAAITYVLIAACSSSSGGGGFAGDGGLLDVLFDTFGDPVNEAYAATPLVVQAACDKQHQHPNGATYLYAEAAFPGKTVEELSAVRVVGVMADPAQSGVGPPYTHYVGTASNARMGFAAAGCGSIVNGQTSYNFSGPLTFILPQ